MKKAQLMAGLFSFAGPRIRWLLCRVAGGRLRMDNLWLSVCRQMDVLTSLGSPFCAVELCLFDQAGRRELHRVSVKEYTDQV